jgi:4-amino-4-deoxy-L-arabinose transferase-like glycosyltransferase
MSGKAPVSLPQEKFIWGLHSVVSEIKQVKILQWMAHFAVPVLFAAVVFLFFHARGRFEFDTDEGINLIKAALVEKGYFLYSEVWSDQPPLLTYLLALGIHFWGHNVEVARNIIFFLSAGLLGAVFEFMQVSWKRTYAYAGCLLILLLPKYLTLSYSVMIGLPSISLAMISLLFLALWHKKRRYVWLGASAIFMSMAVLTKLMIGFLSPIFFLGILGAEYARFRSPRHWRSILFPAGLWGIIFFSISVSVLLIIVKPANLSQLFEDHLGGAEVAYYSNPEFSINYHLQNAWPYLFLAVLGTIFALRAQHWEMFYLAGWMVTAYILLLSHKPAWYHHQLYVTVPAAILGGIAVVEGIDLVRQLVHKQDKSDKWLGWIRVLSLVGIGWAVISFVQTPEPLTVLSGPPSLKTTGLEIGGKIEKIYLSMKDFAPETAWVVTDLPMFAFRAGLTVPPELAVISEKRFLTENLTEAQMLDALIHYEPEQVLLGRFMFPELEKYMETNYTLLLSKNRLKLYVRNDLIR